MMKKRSSRVIHVLLFLCVSLAFLNESAVAAADDKCAGKNDFLCPNCGGIEVTDCLDCNGYLNTDETHSICFDRKLFNKRNTDAHDHDEHYHHLWRDILGTIVWFCAAGVATACGVGGGGIYVPLGIILMGFAPKPSSGLSQASIFGASLGGLILNSRNKHPDEKITDQGGERDDEGRVKPLDIPTVEVLAKEAAYLKSGHKFYTRPLIDYDMALFLAPMEMAGAVLGVLIQKILPNWLYLTLAAFILAFTSFKTFRKYFVSRTIEKEAKKNVRYRDSQHFSKSQIILGESSLPETTPETSESLDESDPETPTETNVEDGVDEEDSETNDTGDKSMELRQQFLEEDSRQFPREKVMALLVLWVGLVLLTFFKGGKGVDSIIGITCKSSWFGVLIAIQFIWTLGFALFFGLNLVKKQKAKKAVHYPFLPNDVLWDNKKLRFYAFFTFLAGVVAGLIGIGGGMVLGPLMLVMGIHPRVSSATTATMIVMTSSSVAVLFVTAGLVPWEYAVFFFFVCLSGAFVGKKYIDGYVKRTGKASLLILILATIIALATLGCVVIVLMRLGKSNWCLAGFNKFCDAGDDNDICAVNRLLGFTSELEWIQ